MENTYTIFVWIQQCSLFGHMNLLDFLVDFRLKCQHFHKIWNFTDFNNGASYCSASFSRFFASFSLFFRCFFASFSIVFRQFFALHVWLKLFSNHAFQNIYPANTSHDSVKKFAVNVHICKHRLMSHDDSPRNGGASQATRSRDILKITTK